MVEVISFNIEELASRGIIRVLEMVCQHGPLNMSSLIRKTGLDYSLVNVHVKKLTKLGLVEDKRYDNIRMIKPGFQQLKIQRARNGR